jgi:hypothetical protein
MTVVVSVLLMVLCALLKGYTTRRAAEAKGVLLQLEAEEKTVRHDRERAEVLRESMEARRNQSLHHCRRATREIEELQVAIERLEEENDRKRDEDA